MQPDSLNRFKQVLAGSKTLCNHFELFFAASANVLFQKQSWENHRFVALKETLDLDRTELGIFCETETF